MWLKLVNVTVRSVIQRDIDARRSNVIIYRAKEIDSELADDRKAGDALLICA